MAKAAKKRKRDEEDEKFEFPEFDEEKYLRHEIELAKATFVTIVLAIPVAVLLYALTLAGVTIVAFFLGLGITFALPRVFGFLPWPKIELAGFERKDWFGQGGTFFFSWLAFWILLINVPIADITPPSIEGVSANGVPAPYLGSVRVSPGLVMINATVLENGALASVVFRVNGVDHQPNRNQAQFTLPVTVGTLPQPVEIRATDAAGHQALYSFTMTS